MTVIDPTTDLGRVRLAIGDWRDITILPDSVINQVLTDTANLRAAIRTCGSYVLATLAFDGQAKLGIIETYGNQVFSQYKEYLTMIVKDANMNGVCPLPYSASGTDLHPILQFEQDFQNSYNKPTSDDRLHFLATQPFDPYSGPVANAGTTPNNTTPSNGV